MPSTARRNGTNPYSWVNHARQRPAAIRAALGTHCPGAVVLGQPWRSPRCDRTMTDPSRMHYDHTTALAIGGTHADRVCCQPCNLGAGAVLGNKLRGARRPGRRLPTW